jgi:hypothetical protein
MNYECYTMEAGQLRPTTVNFIQDMDTRARKSDTPDGVAWAWDVAGYLGYSVCEQFPIYFDGLGLYILVRDDVEEPNDIQRLFKYLGVYCTHYDEDTIIGIPDLPNLLALYHLMRPALMLRSEERFQTMVDDGMWARGQNWREIMEIRDGK